LICQDKRQIIGGGGKFVADLKGGPVMRFGLIIALLYLPSAIYAVPFSKWAVFFSSSDEHPNMVSNKIRKAGKMTFNCGIDLPLWL
jgi:hypothetical protein